MISHYNVTLWSSFQNFFLDFLRMLLIPLQDVCSGFSLGIKLRNANNLSVGQYCVLFALGHRAITMALNIHKDF